MKSLEKYFDSYLIASVVFVIVCLFTCMLSDYNATTEQHVLFGYDVTNVFYLFLLSIFNLVLSVFVTSQEY